MAFHFSAAARKPIGETAKSAKRETGDKWKVLLAKCSDDLFTPLV